MTGSAILDDVSLDVPWALVEAFAGTPRWKPADVNKGADMIVAALERAGVPVTVHEAKIYLSIPFDARVKAGGRTIRAKPPAYALDCREAPQAPITDLELGIDEITFNGRDAVEAYFLGLATLEETDTGAVLSYGRCDITLAGVSVADIADWYYTLQPDDEPIDVPVYTG